MKTTSGRLWRSGCLRRPWLARLAASLLLAAWAGVQAQGVARIGTIDQVDRSEGIIVIGGSSLSYEAGDLRVSYREREVRPAVLRSGLRVSYQTGGDGELREIVLLGPKHLLDLLTTH